VSLNVLLAGWPALRAERVLAETDEYLVLDKPAGVSVTGERHETDLVRIAKEAGEHLLPVHRIDKVTSGVVLLAKTPAAHGPLTRQFTLRTVEKTYLAITRTVGLPPAGTVDLPLAVGRKNRVRIGAPREDIRFDADAARWWAPETSVRPRSYPSLTRFRRIWQGRGHTLLVAYPTTGRRHQIRVHLAWIGHAIAGDPLFPVARDAEPDGAMRTCLHSWRLSFDDHRGRRVSVAAPPGEDFWAPVAAELATEHRTAVLSGR
jgi:tRNA pseudouridine32 synthase/23S rRNA pseudouridine746 synthase/23S rRNA pseudouridine1911/1915/1917 synthase